MKKPIRLTESDIEKIVMKVINEQAAPVVKNGEVRIPVQGTKTMVLAADKPIMKYVDSSMNRVGATANLTNDGQPHAQQNYAPPTKLDISNVAAVLKLITIGDFIKMVGYQNLLSVLKNPEAANNVTIKAINQVLVKYPTDRLLQWSDMNLKKYPEEKKGFDQFIQAYSNK